jgi:hypothetical protein
MPVNVSPKYWAEHLGMPYHQAAIRELERPVEGQTGRGLMALSEGARSFTRYGYADLLRDDRRYTVRHRVFAGTQRLLLSADAASAAAYSRMFQFCGSTGVDLMEPLTCRGRRGTGVPGTRRDGNVDPRLDTRWDWQKFEPWYRVWGRLTYNADASAAPALRPFGTGAPARAVTAALAHASRILPIVTTAHMPSAACDAYWPEIYWNQPIIGEPRPNPYGDTPSPKSFTHVSPLDPQLFSSISEHADELLAQTRGARYSPIDVASWLEELAAAVTQDLAPIDRVATAATRRVVVDARIQAGLGRFFAAKFRAGVLYAIHEKAGDRQALDAALVSYRRAREAWVDLSEQARGVYANDLSVSDKMSERGHWTDRLAAIDEDIARMAARLTAAIAGAGEPRVRAAVASALAVPRSRIAPCTHRPPAGFTPNAAVPLALRITGGHAVDAMTCYYRHVNQAERFESVEMRRRGDDYNASIPAAYSNSPYPLQYYFTISTASSGPTLYPGLGLDRMNLPYFVLRRL